MTNRIPAALPAWCSLAALLAGCASAPLPPAPEAPLAPDFKHASAASAGDVAPPAAWWQLFHDPVLDELQSRLLVGNENLKLAAARVAEARAVLGATRAAQGPTLSASLGATRADSGSGGARSSLRLDAGASWEPDLWGRLAQASQAGQARLQASELDLAAARLSAQATLAQAYFTLRAAEVQRALIERGIAAYERSLALTQARQQAGVVPLSDVLQARTQLHSAQVQVLEAANQRAQAEHAIAVLLGQAPAALALDAGRELPAAPRVPGLLPAQLLQRRPDIAAAAQRSAAARAQIGVADAALLPAIQLSADAGLRGATLSQLLQSPTWAWSLGASLAQTLFDGGARRAVGEQARAQAEQADAAYRQTVLQALQEVEDNLVLADQLQTQAGLQRQALQSAQQALDITLEQYRVGTVSYLNVVTAQTTALGSERSLVDLQQRQLLAVNQLLKNIAGSW